MDQFDNVNPCAAQMNYVEPRQQETAQADFDQWLREPQPILPTQLHPGLDRPGLRRMAIRERRLSRRTNVRSCILCENARSACRNADLREYCGT